MGLVELVVFFEADIVVDDCHAVHPLLAQMVQDERLGEEEDREADGRDD